VSAAGAILRVGLTGGIASGKSTVAGFLRERGAVVLDADRIAHAAIAPGGPAHAAVLARFGAGIADREGRIDRTRLGALVFRDETARRDLGALVHPRVREEIARRIEAIPAGAGPGIAVVDAALLVETGAWREYHRLVVARCPRRTQVRRLRERDGLPDDEIERRLAAQAPLADKLAVADYVVDTDLDLDATRRQAMALWERLIEDRAALAAGTFDGPAGLTRPGRGPRRPPSP